MFRPVWSQFLVDVIIKPGHKGEDCDGNCGWDSEHPDRAPDREDYVLSQGQWNGINLDHQSFTQCEVMFENDGCKKTNPLVTWLTLPSRVATQKKPNSRQHETRKLSKEEKKQITLNNLQWECQWNNYLVGCSKQQHSNNCWRTIKLYVFFMSVHCCRLYS